MGPERLLWAAGVLGLLWGMGVHNAPVDSTEAAVPDTNTSTRATPAPSGGPSSGSTTHRPNQTEPKPPKLKPPRLSNQLLSCERHDLTAEYHTRVPIKCRVPATNASRIQVWKYSIKKQAWDKRDYPTVMVDKPLPPGGELVYDSNPSLVAGTVVWAEGAKPNTPLPAFSLRSKPPTYTLFIHSLTHDSQGIYLWAYGSEDNPTQYSTRVRVRVFRPPTLTLLPHTILSGDPFRATCTASDYYPGKNVSLTWFEEGVEVTDPERIQTQRHFRPDGITTVSTFTSALVGGEVPPRRFTCNFVWHRDAVSLSRYTASGEATVLPKPKILMDFGDTHAICTASCVPRGASFVWLLGESYTPTEGAVETYVECADDPSLQGLRSELPLTKDTSEYTCRLAGYPSTVPVMEHHGRYQFPTEDTTEQQVTLSLEVVVAVVGIAVALILLLAVCVRVVRTSKRRRRF
ncbi:envelope glycoprotein C [Pteropodid alphaherpesvirus 1]|uniref:Envelope glycoprotein C n=1 Tax=Pteropodid alphaherpesvirus 1 TaxID=1343901 RepID=A0A060PYB1_9ALPH|nr:envelope glycoprotein C [Pteropodid alphaherpesvirus 1]BAP00723.1 envelope glycoprotein C [Pteropodid alphaherpesvirus 1]